MKHGAVHHLVAAEVTRLKLFQNTGTLPKITASSRRLLQLLGLALGMAALPSPVFACAACFGKSSDAMAQGMNMGIFALLVVIGSVLIGVASFAIFLVRRAARFPLPQSSAALAAELAAPPAQPIKQSHP